MSSRKKDVSQGNDGTEGHKKEEEKEKNNSAEVSKQLYSLIKNKIKLE